MYDLKIYFLLFIIYSVVGWIIEMIDVAILNKKIVNRGFLIGPYCPVYGVGALLMLIFLNKYVYDPFILFCMSFLICGILEYLTSYIMEKLFKARWWDYSSNKFNLNGRICLGNLVLFGLGGIILFYIANPFVMKILMSISEPVLNVITLILLFLFIVDFCVSFKIIFEFKNIASTVKKDSTEEIKKRVKAVIESKSALYRRLTKSFPDLEIKIKQYNEKLKKIAKYSFFFYNNCK